MKLPYNVRYWLTTRKQMIAAEIPLANPTRRAWVGVYPLPDCEHHVNVRYFEVERAVLEQGYDIAEPDLLNTHTVRAVSVEELAQVLDTWVPDLNAFVQPWKCDYPI